MAILHVTCYGLLCLVLSSKLLLGMQNKRYTCTTCVCMLLKADKVQEIEGELKHRLFGTEDCSVVSECSGWKNGAQNVPCV